MKKKKVTDKDKWYLFVLGLFLVQLVNKVKKKTNHVNLHVLINEHKQCNFQILSTQTIEHLKLKPIELKMTFSLC